MKPKASSKKDLKDFKALKVLPSIIPEAPKTIKFHILRKGGMYENQYDRMF